jgi:hypothetical protein
MVTTVPPATGPEEGEMPDTLGRETSSYMYTADAFQMLLAPTGLMTETSTVPAGFAGVMTVRRLSLTTISAVPFFSPNWTPVAPVNPDPVMVTTVPPAMGPPEGETPVICGAESADTGPADAARRMMAMQMSMQDVNGRVISSDLSLIWYGIMHWITSSQMILHGIICSFLNITNLILGNFMQESISNTENELISGSTRDRVMMPEKRKTPGPALPDNRTPRTAPGSDG